MAATALIAVSATTRRAVSEWVAKGCAVEVKPDGTIRVFPPRDEARDVFDLVDMKQ